MAKDLGHFFITPSSSHFFKKPISSSISLNKLFEGWKISSRTYCKTGRLLTDKPSITEERKAASLTVKKSLEKKMLPQWQAVVETASDLFNLRFNLQTICIRNKRVTARPTVISALQRFYWLRVFARRKCGIFGLKFGTASFNVLKSIFGETIFWSRMCSSGKIHENSLKYCKISANITGFSAVDLFN